MCMEKQQLSQQHWFGSQIFFSTTSFRDYNILRSSYIPLGCANCTPPPPCWPFQLRIPPTLVITRPREQKERQRPTRTNINTTNGHSSREGGKLSVGGVPGISSYANLIRSTASQDIHSSPPRWTYLVIKLGKEREEIKLKFISTCFVRFGGTTVKDPPGPPPTPEEE